jgi:hypothetical protein
MPVIFGMVVAVVVDVFCFKRKKMKRFGVRFLIISNFSQRINKFLGLEEYISNFPYA